MREWFADKGTVFGKGQNITAWQNNSDRVFCGAMPLADWVDDSFLDGAAGGRVYLDGNTPYRLRQHGLIWRVKIGVNQVGTNQTMKVKVFRPLTGVSIGLSEASWVSTTALSGGTADGTERTFVNPIAGDKALTAGTIRVFKASIAQLGAVEQEIKFKIFRANGANYDLVGETEKFTITGTGTQYFTPATPINVLTGDMVGFWLKGTTAAGNKSEVYATAGGTNYFTNSDVTGINQPIGTSMAYTINVIALDYPYVVVGESESIPITAIGTQTFDLAKPVACQPGDVPAIYLTGAAAAGDRVRIKTKNGGTTRYVDGDVTIGDAFSASTAYTLDMAFYSNRPYLMITGDSIAKGNSTVPWYGIYEAAGLTGNLNAQPSEALRIAHTTRVKLQYQNFALGSQKWDWVVSTGLPDGLLVKPALVWIHVGVNDVAAGWDWNDIEPYIDQAAALINAADPKPDWWIDEILPWTAGSDAKAAVIRDINSRLPVKCAEVGATLIYCHDLMGQIRVSTGFLDDLWAAYDKGDGIHINFTGVTVLGTIAEPSL